MPCQSSDYPPETCEDLSESSFFASWNKLQIQFPACKKVSLCDNLDFMTLEGWEGKDEIDYMWSLN